MQLQTVSQEPSYVSSFYQMVEIGKPDIQLTHTIKARFQTNNSEPGLERRRINSLPVVEEGKHNQLSKGTEFECVPLNAAELRQGDMARINSVSFK